MKTTTRHDSIFFKLNHWYRIFFPFLECLRKKVQNYDQSTTKKASFAKAQTYHSIFLTGTWHTLLGCVYWIVFFCRLIKEWRRMCLSPIAGCIQHGIFRRWVKTSLMSDWRRKKDIDIATIICSKWKITGVIKK